MGKNFIAMSVRLFGMTPFAWRFPGTLFGVLMLPLIYFMARYMFNSNNWALFAALVFSFDFMHFVQTRIATIDTYVTFFVMAMYLFMYLYIKSPEGKMWKLCLCGICMGLAIASKWQGVYGAAGLPLLFFPALYGLYRNDKKKAILTFVSCFLWFVIIPAAIYALSYIPFVNAIGGGGIQPIIDNQQNMFDYHSALDATHPFSSNWWEWPFIVRPIWFYANQISPEIRQGISSFGNPAIWWFGIVATIYAFYCLIKKPGNYILIFLLTAYAVLFLPWALVSRTAFIYHYFPSVPFVVLLITYFFKNGPLRSFKWAYAYGFVTVALFFLFYPVLSGMPFPVDFVHTYLRWLPGWVLM
jgi:dolichyl-phosphate-mannose--protein O-mannosyl transferase